MASPEPRRWMPQWMPTTIGVILSVVVGAFFYKQSDDNEVFGAFAGLLVTAIALQLEVLLQQRRFAADELQRDRFMAQVESIKWLPVPLDKSVSGLHHALQAHAPAVETLSMQVVEDFTNRCEDLRRGHYVLRSFDDSELYSSLTAASHREILATCPDIELELEWWESNPVAQVYLQAQAEAVKRGVVVRRLFIYHGEKWTDRLAALAARHRQLGIDTGLTRAKKLTPTMDTTALVIWDEACAQELKLHDNDFELTYTVAPQDIKRLLKDYRLVEGSSTPWPE